MSNASSGGRFNTTKWWMRTIPSFCSTLCFVYPLAPLWGGGGGGGGGARFTRLAVVILITDNDLLCIFIL